MAKTETLKYAWQDNTIDGAVWSTVNNGGTITAAGEVLQFADNDYRGSDSYIETIATFDLTESYVFVKLVASATNAKPYLAVVDPSGDTYRAIVDLTVWRLQYNGSDVGGGTGYASTNHWARLRVASGTIYFDTADAAGADPPSSWTNRNSGAVNGAFDATQVKIRLANRTTAAGAMTTTYDGLNESTTYVPPAPAAPVARGLYL